MSTPESYIEAGRKRLDSFFINFVPHVQLFNPQTALYQAGLVEHTMPHRIYTEQVRSFIVDIYHNIDYILQNEARAKWLHQFLQLTEHSIRPALQTQNTDHQQLFTEIIMKLKIAYYTFQAECLLTQGLEHKQKAEDLKLTARFLQLQLDKKPGHMAPAASSSIDCIDPAIDTKKTEEPEVVITSPVAVIPPTPVAEPAAYEQTVPVIIPERKSFLAAARAAVSKEKIKEEALTEVAAVESKQEPIIQAAPAHSSKQPKKKRTVVSTPARQEHQEEAKKVGQEIKLEQARQAAARLEQERIEKEEKLAAEKQQQRAAERERQRLLHEERQAIEDQRQQQDKQRRKKEQEDRRAALATRRAHMQRTRPEQAAVRPDKTVQAEQASTIITACANLQAMLVEPRLKDSLGAEGSAKYNCFTTIMNNCYAIAGMIKTSLAYAESLHQEIATPNSDDDFAVGLLQRKQKSKGAKEKKTPQTADELEKYLQAINHLFEYFNAELETIVLLDDHVQSILKQYILHVTAEFNMFMYFPKVEHAITLSKYRPLFESIGKLATAIMVKALARKDAALLTLLLNGFLCVHITVKQKREISYGSKELSKQVEHLLKELNPQVEQGRGIDLPADLGRRERFSQFSPEEKASTVCNFIYFYSGNPLVFSERRAIILALCQTLDVTEIVNMAIWFKYIESLSLIFDREEKLYRINQQRIAEGKAPLIFHDRPNVELAFDEPKVLLALIKHMNNYVDNHEELPPPFINEVLRYEKFLTDYIQHVIFCGSIGITKSIDVNLIIQFIEHVKKLKQKKLYNQDFSVGLTRLLTRLTTNLVTFAAFFKARLDADPNEILVVAPIILMSMQVDSEKENLDSICNQKMVLYAKLTLYFNYIHQLYSLDDISSEKKAKDVNRFYEYMLAKDNILRLSLADDFTILPDQDERGAERLAQDVEALQKDVCLELSDENIAKLRQILIEFVSDKATDKVKNIDVIISRIQNVRQHIIILSAKHQAGVAGVAEAQSVVSPVIFGHQLAGVAASVAQVVSVAPELVGNGL